MLLDHRQVLVVALTGARADHHRAVVATVDQVPIVPVGQHRPTAGQYGHDFPVPRQPQLSPDRADIDVGRQAGRLGVANEHGFHAVLLVERRFKR